MAVGYLTSSTLIAAVQRKAMIPVNQSTFTDDDILAFANEELKIGLVPSIKSVHSEYYVYSTSVALQPNVSSYDIPYRALGGQLRDLMYLDASGNLCNMALISPDDRDLYQRSNFNDTSQYRFFYIQGNSVILVPGVSVAPVGSLIFTYYLRTNDLVTEDRVATIQSFTVDPVAGTTTFFMNQIPTGFATNVLFDLMQTRPGHKTIDYDLSAISISPSSKSMVFNTSDIDGAYMVGDYVAFAGECIIPQAPSDLHTVLAERTVARVLEALGDSNGLNAANTKIQEMEAKTMTLIGSGRVEGAPVKVINNRGFLRQSNRRRGWMR